MSASSMLWCRPITVHRESKLTKGALTGTPAGDYWFNAKQLVICLKALSGTVTLGIAQGGMLTLATQDAYYLQNAMRPEAQKKTQKAAQPAAAKAA